MSVCMSTLIHRPGTRNKSIYKKARTERKENFIGYINPYYIPNIATIIDSVLRIIGDMLLENNNIALPYEK